MKNIIFICLFLFVSSFSQAQEKIKSEVSAQQIDKLFEEWDDNTKPGIAIGVVKDGKIDHLKGYGSANLEHEIPIDPTKTKFLYPGMSDQIICFLTLMLEDANKISLDDPITKYLPNVKFGSNIKISNLINHTSGMISIPMLKPLAGYANSENFNYENLSYLLASQSDSFDEAGLKYDKNSIGIRLLQSIIEKASGMGLSELAQKKIFEPLNMNNSLFTDNNSLVLKNKAQGYVPSGDTYQVRITIQDESQSSLFYSTVEDLCKWAINFSRIKVGNQSIIDKMETVCTENGKSLSLKNATLYQGQHGYWNFKGTKKLYLIGQKDGYSCKLVRFPDQDLSIVVMGNTGEYNGYMSSQAADLYLEKYYDTSEPSSIEKSPNISLSSKQLEKYCGKYWDEEVCFTTIISLENDTLRYKEIENGWELNLTPTSENTFVGQWGQNVSFHNENGKRMLRLKVGSGQIFNSTQFDDSSLNVNYSEFEGNYKNGLLKTEFNISFSNASLFLEHSKLGRFEMFPLNENEFRINHRALRHIKFDKGKNSMAISNSKIKDIEYIRLENSNWQ